jgi:hypothetical protein
MMSGVPGWKDRLRSSLQTAWLSSRLSGADLVGAWDDFLGYRRLALLCLVAKPSHVGGFMDRLACRLRCPTNCG